MIVGLASPTFAAEGSSGEEGPVVQCANLVYGRDKSSVCFADHFLAETRERTHIRTADGFTETRLDSEALFERPFAVMTGEGGFTLTPEQRENLRRYLTGGGFLLASAGCSSRPWDAAFRREIERIFPDRRLEKIDLSHPVFHTVYDIDELESKSKGAEAQIEALTLDGRVVLIYSPDGLNDTRNAGESCCCCGGNEILNARRINVNLLAYALTH
jgi:hypothetical protein